MLGYCFTFMKTMGLFQNKSKHKTWSQGFCFEYMFSDIFSILNNAHLINCLSLNIIHEFHIALFLTQLAFHCHLIFTFSKWQNLTEKHLRSIPNYWLTGSAIGWPEQKFKKVHFLDVIKIGRHFCWILASEK